MKIATGLLAIILVLFFLGGVMWALGQFRGADFSEPHIIATDAATSSKNIILANPVLDDSTVNIQVASNNVDDAPVPFSYSYVNRQLTINGLNISDTRTLTILYKVPRLPDFIDLCARYFPAFFIIGCIAALAGLVTGAFRRD